MCNINVIMNLSGEKSYKVTEAMNVVSYNSYQGNDDAEGWFGDGFKIKKSTEKQIMSGKYSFIVSHQRRSTSGKNENMHQPLKSKDFIIVHNGVFSDLGNTKVSDTYEYLIKLQNKYNEVGDTIQAIKSVNYETKGYYSIVLKNRKTGEFYYYKDSGSRMSFIKSTKWLLMSTSKTNTEYLKKYFKVSSDISDVDPYKIYDLNNKFKEVAEFEEKPIPKTKYIPSGTHYSIPNMRSTTPKRDSIEKILNSYGIQPMTIGIHGDHVLLGINEKDLDEFMQTFPLADLLNTKEYENGGTKYLFLIETVDAEELLEEGI